LVPTGQFLIGELSMFSIIDNSKKMKIALLSIIISISCSENSLGNKDSAQNEFTANNLSITAINIGRSNPNGKYRMITFDIKWENSWRTNSPPNNWDAAWVFIKYKTGNREWKHATLSSVSSEHAVPSGTTVTPPSDGKGGGFRGGCFANERLHMCVSVRVEAAVEIDHTHRHIPWGFRGVRTVSF